VWKKLVMGFTRWGKWT